MPTTAQGGVISSTYIDAYIEHTEQAIADGKPTVEVSPDDLLILLDYYDKLPADAAYLRSLVRMDINKKQKSVDRFTAKPGQSAAAAEQQLAKFERNLAYRKEVLARLG